MLSREERKLREQIHQPRQVGPRKHLWAVVRLGQQERKSCNVNNQKKYSSTFALQGGIVIRIKGARRLYEPVETTGRGRS